MVMKTEDTDGTGNPEPRRTLGDEVDRLWDLAMAERSVWNQEGERVALRKIGEAMKKCGQGLVSVGKSTLVGLVAGQVFVFSTYDGDRARSVTLSVPKPPEPKPEVSSPPISFLFEPCWRRKWQAVCAVVARLWKWS